MLGHCQRNAIWGMPGHIISYLFICPLVNSSNLFKNVLRWHIMHVRNLDNNFVHFFKIQLESFKYGLNIFLVNFSLNFQFWNWWQFFDTQGWMKSSAYSVFVFVCVRMCWTEWEREYMCVRICMCMCPCSFDMLTRNLKKIWI